MGLLDRATTRKQSAKETPAGIEYKTNIDKVYFEVQKSKDVSLLALSRKLGISREQVEEYAEILNNQGLLDLYYTGLGSPRLRVKEAKKKLVLKKGKKAKNLLLFTLALLIILVGLIAYIKYLK